LADSGMTVRFIIITYFVVILIYGLGIRRTTETEGD
jgi:hypothetical protein